MKPIDNLGSDCARVEELIDLSCSVLPARDLVCGKRREESKITEMI